MPDKVEIVGGGGVEAEPVIIILPTRKHWVALMSCFSIGFEGMEDDFPNDPPHFKEAKEFNDAAWLHIGHSL